MNIGICGIAGRMGNAILKVLLERGHALSAAFDVESAPCYGKPASCLVFSDRAGAVIGALSADAVRASDGLIDFSSPRSSLDLLSLCVAESKPLVLGTTGLSPDQIKTVEAAARSIPVLMSPNMSLGVNILFKLTEIAARTLPDGFDVEILEAHHRLKKDAPSGTALKLVDIVKKSKSGLGEANVLSGREGFVGERKDAEIAVLAMRGGDIVGEHTVFFTGMGERIELTHRATSRDILARGAVAAMEFLAGRKAGLYSMYDVLGLK